MPLLHTCLVYSIHGGVNSVGLAQLDLCVVLRRQLDWGYADERTKSGLGWEGEKQL